MEPFVSVIIPIRNENKKISECINSILEQTYPKDHLEVLLIDGQSEDNTKDIIEGYAKRNTFVKVYENPKKIVPTGLNIGVRASKGDVIIRMDAHSYYDRDYIERCVRTLKNVDAYNVGGSIITLPSDTSSVAKAIALATSHTFGVGDSKFRTSNKPQYVDTVAFGAFKREIFDHVGLFNEKLTRNQDIEFNSRIRNWGGKIYLNPKIKSYYYNQSTLKGLWKQNFANGMWNVFTLSINKRVLSMRHFIPLVFILSLLGSLALSIINPLVFLIFLFIVSVYLITSMVVSFKIALKEGHKMILILPMTFATLHFGYGFGYIWGLIRIRNFKKSS